MKRVLTIVAAVIGFVVLVGLGLWQWDRSVWKQGVIQEIEAGLAAPPADVIKAPLSDLVFRQVRVRGVWAPAGLVRITPATMNGKVGGDYAAPLTLPNGDVVVALLGWAPEGAPPPTLPEGEVEALGAMTPAIRPTMFTPDNAPPDGWYWLDPQPIARHAGLGDAYVSPLALRLSAPPAGLTARPARPNLPDNHLQYAFTWFGLAAAWAAMAFLLLRRRR